MPRFSFQALDSGGAQISGTLEALTRRDAYRQIESRKLSPVDVIEETAAAGKKAGADAAGTSASESALKLKRSLVIFCTTELADLLDAGLPVQQALNVMAEKQENVLIRRVAARVRSQLSEGQTLSVSFQKSSPSFDDLFTSLVAAGEASGTLPAVLHRLSQSMTQLHELQARFIQAMVYPAFMVGACALLMGVFTLVLVPQLTGLLAKTGQQLPGITRLLLDFSAFCTAHIWTMLIGVTSVVVLFRVIVATKPGRTWWDRFKMRIPLVGPIVETRFYASFTEALGNLVTNGVPLLSALKLLVRGTANRFFRGRLTQVIDIVQSGDPLSTALRKAGNFQSLMTDIIAVGEQTGHLAKSLQKAADRYDKELDKRIKRLTALISPAIIIFLAVVVTVIAYCIVSSIFSAVSGIRGQTG